MADKRLWAKTDVGYLSNPKVAELIEEYPFAVLFHLECFLYAYQHNTDGRVPVAVAMRIACASHADVDAACSAGLITRVDDRHVVVNDYLDHQESAEQRDRRSNAGRTAAKARHGANRMRIANEPHANGNADGTRTASESCAEKRREEKNSPHDSTRPAALFDADRQDVIDLCNRLADRIESNGSKRPTIGKTWHDAARLMLDRDDRDPAEARRLIDWCQGDDFWRTNILSMTAFRKQYDKLRLRAGAEQPQGVSGGLSDYDLNRIATTPRKAS